MKETYIVPEVEVMEFECEDVITTSTPVREPDETPIV